MKTALALAWRVGALALLPGVLSAAEAGRKPNVVFVFADQWRAQATGYAGDPNVRTPTLDKLAACSVRFNNAVSTCPVCSPYRASLLTGQYPLTHGVFLNDVSLGTQAVSLAQAFRGAGYRTGYIGKWHVDGRGRSNFIPRERRQGFEFWKVLECTHDYNHSAYYADAKDKLLWEGYDAAAQTRAAQRYIREHAAGGPFLLMLSWGPPHDPYQTAPEAFRALYDPALLKLRPNVPTGSLAAARRSAAGYYAHCSALDDCLGQIWATLRETGLERDTILVFTSDHGDLLGSHGRFGKQAPYDESVCVPLLVHWPRLGDGARVVTAPFAPPDFMPTLLGLCGVDIPKTVEGLDFSRHLRGGPAPGDGAALVACYAMFAGWVRRNGGCVYRGVRTERYTYVRKLDGPWLLFDNQADPGQQKNLCNTPAAAALQEELDTRLQRKLRDTHDEFLPGAKYVEQWHYTTDANGTVPYRP